MDKQEADAMRQEKKDALERRRVIALESMAASLQKLVTLLKRK